jgi:hypothetical protein
MPYDSSPRLTVHRTAVLLSSGFMSGLASAFLFNPWDRALYLSVKCERPFLLKENWQNPFRGVTQTVIQRAISSGLYFPLEQIFTELFNAYEEQNEKRKSTKLFISGMSAGAINGVIMNPLTRIKVNRMWDC